MISQMKKRMEENDKMEKEIQERKKDCFKKMNKAQIRILITRYTSMHIDCIIDRSNSQFKYIYFTGQGLN